MVKFFEVERWKKVDFEMSKGKCLVLPLIINTTEPWSSCPSLQNTGNPCEYFCRFSIEVERVNKPAAKQPGSKNR